VNTANGRVFAPDLTGLHAAIIAVDGMYASHPIAPAGFELAPGNRLDLDVTIPPDTAPGDVEIVDRFTRRPFRIATVRVAGAPSPSPDFSSPACGRVPAWRGAETIRPALSYDLNAERGGPFGIAWTLNGEVYSDHAAHRGGTLGLGKFARLRFVNQSYRLHPMHIHGMFFKVLARNGVAVDEGFWRDTALVHPKETLDVGVVPLDPGRWMLHCHVLEHAEAGMMTTVEVPAVPPSDG
jgi:FtsP/CotA-like multicopper oxidase with cupredoxin domain